MRRIGTFIIPEEFSGRGVTCRSDEDWKGFRDTRTTVGVETPSGGSEFQAYRDDTLDPPALVVQVGTTEVRYHVRCITDLHALLKSRSDWVPLGNADDQKPPAEGTVGAWARSAKNPVGGWYGLKKGLRGRFGNYVPPLMETLGLAEVEHNPKNNRMRAFEPPNVRAGYGSPGLRLPRPSRMRDRARP